MNKKIKWKLKRIIVQIIDIDFTAYMQSKQYLPIWTQGLKRSKVKNFRILTNQIISRYKKNGKYGKSPTSAHQLFLDHPRFSHHLCFVLP